MFDANVIPIVSDSDGKDDGFCPVGCVPIESPEFDSFSLNFKVSVFTQKEFSHPFVGWIAVKKPTFELFKVFRCQEFSSFTEYLFTRGLEERSVKGAGCQAEGASAAAGIDVRTPAKATEEINFYPEFKTGYCLPVWLWRGCGG